MILSENLFKLPNKALYIKKKVSLRKGRGFKKWQRKVYPLSWH